MRDPQLDRQLEENLALLTAMALGLVVICFYAWTINFPAQYQDVVNLLANPGVAAFQKYVVAPDWAERWTYFPDMLHRNLARPVLGMSYLIGAAYAEQSEAGHRLVNLVLHLGCVMLAFLLVRRGLREARGPDGKSERGDLGVAALIAGVFGLHPLQIESVVYLSGRDALLGALPTLGAFAVMGASLRAARYGEGLSLRLGNYLVGVGIFIFALLCGESALALPPLLLLYDWAVLRPAPEEGVSMLRERIVFHAPLFVLAGAYALLLRVAADASGDPAIGGDFSALATYPAAWLGYLRLLYFPVGLTVDHGFATRQSLAGLVPALALLANAGLVGLAIVLARRGERLIAAGLLGIYAALLPWAGILSYNDPVVEHRAYLAVLPATLLGALVVSRAWRRIAGEQRVRAGLAAAAVLALLLGAMGAARARVWETQESLWSDAARKHPELARPHYQLGTAYLLGNHRKQAMEEFGEALRADPDYFPAALNRGGLFLEDGDLENARRNFERAVRANPEHAPSRYNLAEALFRMGRPEEALSELRVAIKITPDNGNFLEKEGEILESLGRHEDALAAWDLAIEKGVADQRKLMERAALVAFQHGYYNTASKHLRNLTYLDPTDAHTWFNFAYFKEEIGETDEAIANYQRAIMVNPALGEAHFNLARLYEMKGKCTDAES
ncbi:MAG: tetratricopeptide repeat protein, partial [Chrysiogenetes bacterium]|nr:tetratricopeptide repeat protein [Chrysiogenetes bacterium]